MSRLIDADKIDLREIFKGESNFAKSTREAGKQLIDKQPTALEWDKVFKKIIVFLECKGIRGVESDIWEILKENR